MEAFKIKDGIYWVGALDEKLRIFDVIMRTEWGTSYNSYYVEGKEKRAVIDMVKGAFFDEHVERLKKVCDLSKIDYIVINHTEPDHSGSLAAFLKLCPNATVLCSRAAATFLNDIVNEKFNVQIVNEGDTVDLGGKTLKFLSVPFLHWPDSIFTYITEDAVLSTGDVFGFHFATPGVFDDSVSLSEEMVASQKYYFDVIMGPFKPYVLTACKKARELKIDVICPSHGPVLRKDPWVAIERYEQWAQPRPENVPKRVFIGYVSCYGYTKALAEECACAVQDAGLQTELADLSEVKTEEAIERINNADAFIIGSPTLNRDVLEPVWHVLTGLSVLACKGKPAAAIGSYGWSGEAVKYIEERLKNIGCVVAGTATAKLKPNEAERNAAYELGQKLAETIK